ncbi:MAG: DUF2937 family protein [Proteobacteria bacterium]|nr:DUF2937 family protein [Pseudomonadota bacterium]
MNWFVRKLDSLGGAIFAGVFFAAASQFAEFVQQYTQRLGGHLDEARRYASGVADTDRHQAMNPTTRESLVNEASNRVSEIEQAHQAISDADIFSLPWEFFRHFDYGVASRTWEQFSPAVPVDLEGGVYAGIGILLGLFVYELVKLPFLPLTRGKKGKVERAR